MRMLIISEGDLVTFGLETFSEAGVLIIGLRVQDEDKYVIETGFTTSDRKPFFLPASETLSDEVLSILKKTDLLLLDGEMGVDEYDSIRLFSAIRGEFPVLPVLRWSSFEFRLMTTGEQYMKESGAYELYKPKGTRRHERDACIDSLHRSMSIFFR